MASDLTLCPDLDVMRFVRAPAGGLASDLEATVERIMLACGCDRETAILVAVELWGK